MPADVVIAEASAWLVRLNSPQKSSTDQAAFQEWLRADSAHVRAYELAAQMWTMIPRAARLNAKNPGARPRARIIALAATAVASVIAVAWFVMLARMGPSYETAVGEQRTVILSDGTKVTLNTNSALTVRYTRSERRTYLNRGEAMFEVAQNPRRPFLVQAAGELVRAIGTTFVVRVDPTANYLPEVAVTLIEGKVEVESNDGARQPQASVLEPGQRATLHRILSSSAKAPGASQWLVDEPKLAAVTAWRRGDVVFEDASLREAVAELRRYGGPDVKFPDPSVGTLRVSGVFGLRDITESLQAMAEVHRLKLRHSPDGLVLER